MHIVARYGSLASSFILLAMCLGALALNLTDIWHFTPGTAAPAVFVAATVLVAARVAPAILRKEVTRSLPYFPIVE
ncbi:hypothetical protein R6G99_01890, partial [Actinotignum timonense]|nr:hypothetical protein [Actinotignum timonense]